MSSPLGLQAVSILCSESLWTQHTLLGLGPLVPTAQFQRHPKPSHLAVLLAPGNLAHIPHFGEIVIEVL